MSKRERERERECGHVFMQKHTIDKGIITTTTSGIHFSYGCTNVGVR